MVKLVGITPRKYQKNIAKVASSANTLVVLPTGMGKTLIGLLVAIKRMNDFPSGKVLLMAPTRPLASQHRSFFLRFSDLEEEEVVLLTGKIRPEKRKPLYEGSRVVVATPQVIRNDILHNLLDLSNFVLLIFDEAHRCIKDYAYTFIAKEYMRKGVRKLILGLTASPGGSYERIEAIKRNLFIQKVEIRSEKDSDVASYVKPVRKKWIYVELTEEMKFVKSLLEDIRKELVSWLKSRNFLKGKVKKSDVIKLQGELARRYRSVRSSILGIAMTKAAMLLKVEHAIELLETQDISALEEYMRKLGKKRTEKILLSDERFKRVLELVREMKVSGRKHPKLEKLIEIVPRLTEKGRVIIFANYRRTVEMIKKQLEENGISSEILIGQAKKGGKGMKQEEQIDVIRRFGNGEFKVLIGTSVSEEGLDVPAVEYAIFYEPVPSEIRSIQRRGRVGRHAPGMVIFLITKGTRDESYYWSSLHKERRMKGILYEMKGKKTITEWLNK